MHSAAAGRARPPVSIRSGRSERSTPRQFGPAHGPQVAKVLGPLVGETVAVGLEDLTPQG